MAVLETPRPDTKSLFISEEQMEEFRAITARQFEEAGIVYDPTATAEDSQRAFLNAGIRPEENFLSRGIIAAREVEAVVPTLIESMRIERRMSAVQAASFIGVNLNGYWDLEWHNDEPWVLDVIRFVRLCILYKTLPSALLPEKAFYSDKKWLKFDRNEYGETTIASTLKGCCQDIGQVAEEIGWEEEALKTWLSGEEQIGSMNLMALDDLCRHLSVSTSDVLEEFCSALGQQGTLP